MKQPGFMIYAEDWNAYMVDYSDREIGRMLRALLGYFDTREEPSFSDRGMRQFFRLASRGIDLDIRRYEDKCRKNAYVRYRGVCKQNHEKPLSFEEWTLKADRGQPTSTNVTKPNTSTNTSSQQSETSSKKTTVKNELSEMNDQQSALSANEGAQTDFGTEPYRPLSEDMFERLREERIASLRGSRLI